MLLGIAFALLAATDFRFTGDTEHYVGLAREIARGNGLSANFWRQTQFPPGFPLILAPVAFLFDGSFTAISRWAAILASLVFPLTWLYLKRRGNRFAFSIAILTVCSVEFLTVATDNPMSDVAYLALSLAVLIWADSREDPAPGHSRLAGTFAGCLLLIALPAVRTIGVAAVLAAIGVAAARAVKPIPGERRLPLRDAIPILAAVGFLFAWFVGIQHGHGGYLHDLLMADPLHPDLGRASVPQLLLRPLRNLTVQATHIDQLLALGVWIKPTWFTPALLAVPVILTGWWQDLRGRRRYAAVYFICYTGIVLLWPYDVGVRFFLPVLPLIWMYLFEGVHQATKAIQAGRGWVRMVGLIWSSLAIVAALVFRTTPGLFGHAAALAFWTLALAGLALAWRPLQRIAGVWGARQTGALVVLGTALLATAAVARAGPLILARARGTLPIAGVQKSLLEASRWIMEKTPPDARIETTYASRIHFATGRPTIYLPITLNPVPFVEVAERHHPQFLFIVEADDPYYTPNDVQKFEVLKTLFGDRMRQVHHFDGGSIYALAPER